MKREKIITNARETNSEMRAKPHKALGTLSVDKFQL